MLALLLLLPAQVLTAVVAKHQHPYRKHWKKSTFGKRALAGVGIGAGMNQARKHPKEWGNGAAGFGKRLGAGFATHAVKNTVEHAVSAPLHEDLSYHRSRKRDFGHRLGHALLSTVYVRNTRNGRKRPAAGRISGNAAAGAVSQTIVPAASGAATAGFGLAATAGANVAREFWPAKKRAHHHRRS
jgi:hypothetical protein